MKLGLILNGIKTLGPGRRLCVWFAGCPHRCAECATPELWDASLFAERDIAELLKRQRLDGITGLTVSGGEPFMQPKALNEVLDFALSSGIRDTLVYTGYTLHELELTGNPDVLNALKKTAVLIDGRYICGLDTGQRLQGSSNQRMHIFCGEFADMYTSYCAEGRRVQVAYAAGGVHLAGLMPKIKHKVEEVK